MGLLDSFNDPQSMGLLNAAAQILQGSGQTRQPFGLGQAMGVGIQSYMQGNAAGMAQKQQQAEEEQQRQMRAMQMARAQQEMAQQEGVMRKQGQIDDAFRQSMPGGQIDPQALISRVMQIDPQKGMELQAKFAKQTPEFYGDVKTGQDAQGRPFQYILDKQGNQKRLDGTLPREEMKLANLNNRMEAYNPFNMTPGQVLKMGQSPDSAASTASAAAARAQADRHFNANYGLAQERLGVDRQEANTKATMVKAPTEFQGKSAAFGLRATESDKILNQLGTDYSMAGINTKQALGEFPLLGGAMETGANKLLSDNSQKAEQAQRDFVNAVLRQESGAAIGANEFQNAKKQYFPQPGDSEAVIKQKATNRQLAIQGFDNNAGRAKITAPAAAGSWGIKRID